MTRSFPALARLLVACLLLAASPLSAASLKHATLSTKVGKSNVQVRVLLHPQVDGCAPAQTKQISAEALRLGAAHVRANLPTLVRKAGTDASKPGEFFGMSYLAGCPKDGTAWIAFPAEGKDKQVTRFAPGLGWSGMMKL
ncbi:hypothetical protein [Methylopila sp. M107]|uniref:hypothetical protein n=1 Tax=Methylopila sp. M107 TaxID=1101190 RepID=UPI000366647A|nr:hypothetical protein [Methylopila sp. M107]